MRLYFQVQPLFWKPCQYCPPCFYSKTFHDDIRKTLTIYCGKLVTSVWRWESISVFPDQEAISLPYWVKDLTCCVWKPVWHYPASCNFWDCFCFFNKYLFFSAENTFYWSNGFSWWFVFSSNMFYFLRTILARTFIFHKELVKVCFVILCSPFSQ